MKMKRFFVSMLLSLIFLVSQFGFVTAKQIKKNEKIDPIYLESIYNSSEEQIVILQVTGLDAVKFSEKKQVSMQSTFSTKLEEMLVLDENYASNLRTRQTDILKTLQEKTSFTVMHTYQYAYNGIAIKIRGYNIRFILGNSQIEKIHSTLDLSYPVRDIEVVTISADKAWKLTDGKKTTTNR